MNELDDKLRVALREVEPLSEARLDEIRKETQAMFEKEKRSNTRWTLSLTVAGFLMLALWGWLFWQAESTKFQILWACFLVGEGLGIALSFIVHLLIENNLTDRQERRELELQIAEIREQLKRGAS